MKYKCDNCGFTKTTYFGLCPQCKEGFGAEVSDVQAAPSPMQSKLQSPGVSQFFKVSDSSESEEVFRSTGFASLDRIISSKGGLIEGQVILLAASPGVGKSTLSAQISSGDSLYISTEESHSQVARRISRIGASDEILLATPKSIEDLVACITDSQRDFVVVDSLNSIGINPSYQATANYAAMITSLCKDLGKTCVIISQVSKGGEVLGMNSTVHVVDTVLHMDRRDDSENIVLSCSKNRFGDIGNICAFKQTPTGVEEVDMSNGDPEPGRAHSEILFGTKKMPVGVETLVVPSSAAYGKVSCSGISSNEVVKIAGILSHSLKLNLGSYDIYVSVDNGLYINGDQGNLMVAAAILSSLKSKAYDFEQLDGKLHLNGRISNNDKYSNITELWKLIK